MYVAVLGSRSKTGKLTSFGKLFIERDSESGLRLTIVRSSYSC